MAVFRKFTTRDKAEEAIKNGDCVPPIITIQKKKREVMRPSGPMGGILPEPFDQSGFYAPESKQPLPPSVDELTKDLFDKLRENINNYARVDE